MKAILITGLTLITVHFARTQSYFQKTFGGSLDDKLTEVTDYGDGFILSGITSSSGAGGSDIWVIRLDNDGDVVWSRTYGGGDDELCRGHFITSDSGIVVMGSSESFISTYTGGIVFKLDADGNVLWANRHSDPLPSAPGNYFSSGYENEDGNLIFSGGIFAVGLGSNEAWMCKLSDTGDMIWEKYVSGSSNDHFQHVIPGESGNSYFVCPSYSWDGSGAFQLAKVDTDGNLLWMKGYGGSGYEGVVHGVTAPDNGPVMIGYTTSYGAGGYDIYAIHTDTDGNVLWERSYGGPGDEGTPSSLTGEMSIKELVGIGYVISCQTESFGAGDFDHMIIYIDYNGDLIRALTFGGTGYEEQYEGFAAGTEGRVAYAGSTESVGVGGQDYYIIVRDSADTHLCDPVGPTVTSPSSTVFDVSPAMGSVASYLAITLTEMDYIMTGDNFCFCGDFPYTLTNDTIVCHGSSLVLNASGADSYNWSPSTGLSCTDCPNPTASPGETTTYYVDMELSGGLCTATDSVVVMVSEGGAPIDLGPDTTICLGETLILDAGPGFDSYDWSSGETTQTYTFGAPTGTWDVEINAYGSDGCVSSDEITISVVICTGISESELDDLVKIYPNPTKDIINIEADIRASFVLRDAVGRKIRESTELPESINIESLPSGVYFLDLENEKYGQLTRRIIKH